MKIDDRVEQMVRDTLHWVVKRRPNDFEAALKAFPDDQSRRAALELLIAITAFVIFDSYEGKPTEDELLDLSADIADMEQWAAVTKEEVHTFLSTVLAGQQLEVTLPPQVVVVLAFVVAGSLLSARDKPEGEWWFDYLDKVEAAIEASDQKN